MKGVGSSMAEQGSFHFSDGSSNLTPTLHAKDLLIEKCEVSHAVALIKQWHSRLPECTSIAMIAFRAHFKNETVAVAVWSNCSARLLPQDWMELRRMACSPQAPKNTASRMLSIMTRLLVKYFPLCSKAISYQDVEVHKGTIYKAAGWTQGAFYKGTNRDRSKIEGSGKHFLYRTGINGQAPDHSPKIRWEKELARN